MLRTLLGYAVLAVIGIIALKLLFLLMGLAISLAFTVLWSAAIGFVFYLILKVISPNSARRVREVLEKSKPRKAA